MDGGRWEKRTNYAHNYNNGSDWGETSVSDSNIYLEVRGHELISYPRDQSTTFDSREFEFMRGLAGESQEKVRVKISDDGQSIVVEDWAQPQPSMYWKFVYKRIK